MKLDFYISSLSGGGAEKVLTTIANECAARGDSVRIVSLEKRSQFYIPAENVTLVRAKKYDSRFVQVIRDFQLVRSCVLENKDAIAVSFLSRCNILVLLASAFTGRKVIVCDRNNPLREHGRLTFFLSQLLYLFLSSRVVVQTQEIKQMYMKALQKKIVVIENPIDMEMLSNQIAGKPLKRDLHRIISMGRLENQKDFKTLISAFGSIQRDYPEWKLDIYGIGYQQQMLQNYIDELKLTEVVKLQGRTSEPFYEMKISSVFVLSSFYEGFPNVLCEALYAGCLCISSNCTSGPAELIEDGQNGFIFEVGDVNKLAELLKVCILHQSEMEAMRDAAVYSVRRLSKEKIIGKWISIFHEVLAK